ncbi:hypothetical protein PV08_05968 [Exophiala spinifera]|uniref:Cutinase n=1 Tax=Exophiala spinifera TaxID=91928 RepID=A0A0D2BAA1_9EURO|nr:uncharacterized protein PV08_05968 [Exophiala spinifera]KIW15918.1 hypothetical protein PV08_05968 [Exophiala spinifera]
MKLSWFALLSTTVILRANLVLSQDDSSNPGVNPDAQVDPTTPSSLSTQAESNARGDPNVAVVLSTNAHSRRSSGGEPVPEEGSKNDLVARQEIVYAGIPHIPDNCSDIRVFSFRGSNEPYPGRGGAMLGTLCALIEPKGLSCDYEDVDYPANISWSGLYCSSAHIGTTAGVNQMTDYVQKCPDSRLVMLGYSQGANVASDILGGGGGELFGCQQAPNPPLSRDIKPGSNIVAVVTMGNPRNTADQPYNLGRGSNYSGELGRSGQQLVDLNKYEDVMANWCNYGDPVCAVGSEPTNLTAHWDYYDEYSYVASEWVVATVMGYTDERLDLTLDGQNQSVVLVNKTSDSSSGNNGPANAHNSSGNVSTGSGNGSNGSRGGGGDEDGAFSFRSNAAGGLSVLMLVALVTAGLSFMI